MSSDSIQKLKALSREQQQLASKAKVALAEARQNYSGAYLHQEVHRLTATYKQQSDALEQRRQSASADIQQRARSKAQSTPEAVDRVRRALDRGMSYLDLVKQLTQDNDRAGLAALRAELPYMGKQLSGVIDPAEILDRHEQRLFDNREIMAQEEHRLAATNSPLLQWNAKEFEKWLGWQTLGESAAAQPLGGAHGLYAWYGQSPEKQEM